MSERSSEGTSGTFRVAALQMVSAPDRERNIAEAGRLIAEAARGGAQLVLLPEYFCYMGFKDTDKLSIRETPGRGPIQQFLADAAREHRVWVIGGTLPLESSEASRVLIPSWSLIPPASRSPATTRFICSTSRKARNPSTKHARSAQAAKCRPSTRRLDAWGCRCATT